MGILDFTCFAACGEVCSGATRLLALAACMEETSAAADCVSTSCSGYRFDERRRLQESLSHQTLQRIHISLIIAGLVNWSLGDEGRLCCSRIIDQSAKRFQSNLALPMCS